MNFPNFLQALLPQHLLSRLIGLLANCRYALVKNWLIDRFIAYYGVNMDDPVKANPHCYESFNQFFTRALKPDRRPITKIPNTIVCPVDGRISQMGKVKADQLLQAKGSQYHLQALLGGCSGLRAAFQNGEFITFYLSPKDYHRVHIPLSGQLRQMVYVPGRLFSVNNNTVFKRSNLFTRNERVITIFETLAGSMAVILIGAMLVASISTTWANVVTPSRLGQIHSWSYFDDQVSLNRADQLGHFQLGSTVILLFGADKVSWDQSLHSGKTVYWGQSLGHILS